MLLEFSGTHCGSTPGIFTRTGTYSPESGSRSTNPQLVDRFEMKGEGCAGSNPSGVSAGETLLSK